MRAVDPDDVNKVDDDADLDDWDSGDEGELFEDVDAADQAESSSDEDEEDAFDEELVDRAFIDSLGGAVRVNAGSVNADALRNKRWSQVVDTFEDDTVDAYQGLTTTPGGPVARLAEVFDNPASLFFSFFPCSLWKHIAKETNRYERQTRGKRAADMIAIQRRRHALDPEVVVDDMATVRARMRLTPTIEPWEIAKAVGLLIANVLCTHHTGIFQHWSAIGKGAIPNGIFGLTMPRNRFQHILRFLHFSDNNTRDQVRVKAWKIRPVVTVLQQNFRSLWELTLLKQHRAAQNRIIATAEALAQFGSRLEWMPLFL
jgi:hypothetical protein